MSVNYNHTGHPAGGVRDNDVPRTRLYVSRFVGEDTPTLVEGDGAVVGDDAGNEYIDLFGHHATLSVGYSHPKVVDAVPEQINNMNFAAYDFPTEPNQELTHKLAEVTPGARARQMAVTDIREKC